MMLGTLVAPLLGGIVLEKAGYNAVFIMTLGVIAVDIILRLVLIERKKAAKWMPQVALEIEKRNESFSSTSTLCLPDESSANNRIQKYGPSASSSTSTLACEECEIESKKGQKISHRQLPAVVLLLKSRRVLTALFGGAMVSAVFVGLETVLSLEVQSSFEWNSTAQGLIFLPLAVMALAGPQIGKVCDKYGARWLAFFSFLGLCPALTLMMLVTKNDIGHKVLLCALLAVAGLCIATLFECFFAEIAYIVKAKAVTDPKRYGDPTKSYAQGYGLLNTASMVGNIFGPLLAGLLRDSKGWGTTCWVFGLLSGISAIPIVFFCGGWLFQKSSSLSRLASDNTSDSEVRPGTAA